MRGPVSQVVDTDSFPVFNLLYTVLIVDLLIRDINQVWRYPQNGYDKNSIGNDCQPFYA